MRRALQGWRLLWRSIPLRRRLLFKANLLMWAQIAWVTSLRTVDSILETRASRWAFLTGTLASTTYVGWQGLKLAHRMKRWGNRGSTPWKE